MEFSGTDAYRSYRHPIAGSSWGTLAPMTRAHGRYRGFGECKSELE